MRINIKIFNMTKKSLAYDQSFDVENGDCIDELFPFIDDWRDTLQIRVEAGAKASEDRPYSGDKMNSEITQTFAPCDLCHIPMDRSRGKIDFMQENELLLSTCMLCLTDLVKWVHKKRQNELD